MRIKELIKYSCSTILLLTTSLHAGYFPTPLTAPDDSNIFFRMNKDEQFALGLTYEDGSAGGGFNSSDQKCSLGSMYDNGESFLAMLRNPRGTVRTNLAALDPQLLNAPDLGGQRGIIDASGHVSHQQITLAGGYNISWLRFVPGFLDVAFHVPFVSKKYTDVKLQRRHFEPVDMIDILIEEQTQNLNAFLQQYGELNAENWAGSGVGDPTLIMHWNLPQKYNEETIQDINPYLYFGIQMPLSKQRNVDTLFSLPLGNDGHWGFPFGGGIDFTFDMPVKIGLGIDLLYFITESRMMRVKTDTAQTSLLLLNKAHVQRKPGLTWRVNWFVSGDQIWHGFGMRAGYEFIMHHNDELKTQDTGFSSEIINTTAMAQSWYVNLLSVMLKYDLSSVFLNAPMAPVIQGFMKFPISGRHVVNASTVGFQVMLHF
ncbi:hypothetical protein FJ364_02460 [Candidatus Dependentiae bacterium]|nr:hypothetical protein [Candidatus Dependentiae bacterium]